MSDNGAAIEEEVLTAAIDDAALSRFARRDLIAGTEVVDFLLDLRALTTRDPRGLPGVIRR